MRISTLSFLDLTDQSLALNNPKKSDTHPFFQSTISKLAVINFKAGEKLKKTPVGKRAGPKGHMAQGIQRVWNFVRLILRTPAKVLIWAL